MTLTTGSSTYEAGEIFPITLQALLGSYGCASAQVSCGCLAIRLGRMNNRKAGMMEFLKAAPKTSKTQMLGRILLGLMLINAGVSHLTYARQPFQAQVPPWIPLDPDSVVLASGCVEILLGLSLVAFYQYKAYVGLIAALFFIAIFPGNIAQYTQHRPAFGLETDTARLVRLFFQPVLIAWALWSTGGWTALRQSLAGSTQWPQQD
jgi:uncharacterized membrane protein